MQCELTHTALKTLFLWPYGDLGTWDLADLFLGSYWTFQASIEV